MFKRDLKLPKQPTRSFFLWGSRQTGKTSLLRTVYPNAYRIDLLKSEEFSRLSQRPQLLREELLAFGANLPPLVIIDEVQKVPSLLDEVHWLIEEKKIIFALCGSSARKLKRGHANLLGGRALRYVLHGLESNELGGKFDLLRILNNGYLPLNYLDEDPLPGLRAYISDYLKEEIAAEGLVRNLPAFGRFLEIAAISDGNQLVFSNIAQDCGVSSPTVREYFQILEDTLLGSLLPAYIRRAKRRLKHGPKFYFSDVGVVNVLSKRGKLEWGAADTGHAFENWIFHELKTHSHYSGQEYDLSYWHTAGDIEVDFILGDAQVAIEAKAVPKVSAHHLKPLYEIKREYPSIKRRILVCLEQKRRITEEGIEIIPAEEFVQELWAGGIVR